MRRFAAGVYFIRFNMLCIVGLKNQVANYSAFSLLTLRFFGCNVTTP